MRLDFLYKCKSVKWIIHVFLMHYVRMLCVCTSYVVRYMDVYSKTCFVQFVFSFRIPTGTKKKLIEHERDEWFSVRS